VYGIYFVFVWIVYGIYFGWWIKRKVIDIAAVVIIQKHI
jgi:hypothetical protein